MRTKTRDQGESQVIAIQFLIVTVRDYVLRGVQGCSIVWHLTDGNFPPLNLSRNKTAGKSDNRTNKNIKKSRDASRMCDDVDKGPGEHF